MRVSLRDILWKIMQFLNPQKNRLLLGKCALTVFTHRVINDTCDVSEIHRVNVTTKAENFIPWSIKHLWYYRSPILASAPRRMIFSIEILQFLRRREYSWNTMGQNKLNFPTVLCIKPSKKLLWTGSHDNQYFLTTFSSFWLYSIFFHLVFVTDKSNGTVNNDQLCPFLMFPIFVSGNSLVDCVNKQALNLFS